MGHKTCHGVGDTDRTPTCGRSSAQDPEPSPGPASRPTSPPSPRTLLPRTLPSPPGPPASLHLRTRSRPGTLLPPAPSPDPVAFTSVGMLPWCLRRVSRLSIFSYRFQLLRSCVLTRNGALRAHLSPGPQRPRGEPPTPGQQPPEPQDHLSADRGARAPDGRGGPSGIPRRGRGRGGPSSCTRGSGPQTGRTGSRGTRSHPAHPGDTPEALNPPRLTRDTGTRLRVRQWARCWGVTCAPRRGSRPCHPTHL